MRPPHRKRVKHYEEERHVHELTFSCFRRLPILTNDLWRTWFCERVHGACERQQFLLLAYVLMPEHVHLMVYPVVATARIASLLSDIKRPYSRRIKQHLEQQRSPLLTRLTIRQRPDVQTFRYWQEGPGYDRNLTESETIIAAIEYIHANPVRRGLCQKAVDWPRSSASRLLNDGPLDETPRLSRFDPELFETDSLPQLH